MTEEYFVLCMEWCRDTEELQLSIYFPYNYLLLQCSASLEGYIGTFVFSLDRHQVSSRRFSGHLE